jgi:hypothetical protein
VGRTHNNDILAVELVGQKASREEAGHFVMLREGLFRHMSFRSLFCVRGPKQARELAQIGADTGQAWRAAVLGTPGGPLALTPLGEAAAALDAGPKGAAREALAAEVEVGGTACLLRPLYRWACYQVPPFFPVTSSNLLYHTIAPCGFHCMKGRRARWYSRVMCSVS